MKRLNLSWKERTTFEVAALFVFLLVLVSNLAVLRFAEGYFEFYGVPMAEVGYVPQMYDYLRIALPVMTASVVFTSLIVGVIWLSGKAGDATADFTKLGKRLTKFLKRNEQFLTRVLSILGALVWIGTALLILWALWVFLYSVSATLGRSYAENKSSVTSISEPGEITQRVIIHKGDNELILKVYDTSKREFTSGYEVVGSPSYNAHLISL